MKQLLAAVRIAKEYIIKPWNKHPQGIFRLRTISLDNRVLPIVSGQTGNDLEMSEVL